MSKQQNNPELPQQSTIKSKFASLFASRRSQMLGVIGIFVVFGGVFLFRSYAAVPYPGNGDPNTLVFSLGRDGGLSATKDANGKLHYNYQDVIQRVFADGTIECGNENDPDNIYTKQVSARSVSNIVNTIKSTGAVTDASAINNVSNSSISSAKTDGTTISVSTTGSSSTSASVISKDQSIPGSVTTVKNDVNKECQTGTKKIERNQARTIKSAKLSSGRISLQNFAKLFNVRSLLSRINPFDGKVEAAGLGDETYIYDQVNDYRVSQGRAKLSRSTCVSDYAKIWSVQMGTKVGLTHSNLSNLATYIQTNCGGSWHKIGENIGQGPTAAAVMAAWKASPAHNANMLDPSYNVMGIGSYAGGGTNWYTQEFVQCTSSCGTYIPPTTLTGSLDTHSCKTTGGWVLNTAAKNTSATVHVYYSDIINNANLTGYPYGPTNVSRPDVNAVLKLPASYNRYGFSAEVPAVWRSKSAFIVRIYGIDNKTNPLLGTAIVTGCGLRGSIDGDNCSVINGWMFNYFDTSRASGYAIYIKNKGDTANRTRIGKNVPSTTVARADVNKAYGIAGIHGYSFPIPANFKHVPHTVELYGLGQPSVGQGNVLLASKDFTCR